jgi:hypothetical protein
MRTTRETPGFSSQASQVMTQFRIVTFYRIGFGFALGYLIATAMIPKPGIFFETIAEVPLRLGSFVNHCLNGFPSTDPDDRPAQNAACVAVDERQDVEDVFLSPMKVNNSSISASFTSSGTGASGSDMAWSLTQRDTVRWCTFRWRAIRLKLPPSTYISLARLRKLSG